MIEDGSSQTGQGFGPIEISAYQRHLAFLAAARRKGVLWTAPPSTVIEYRHARIACGASVSGETISFDTSDPECTELATPISVIVTTGEDVPRVDGTQDGQPGWTRKLGPGRFSVTADPSQGDGRTGTWSWYPQNADVSMAAEAGGKVLRYAGTALGAWTGVTLAFLGGNGAGACYDGSAYIGIRFRIRGNVSSGDELDGKVVVSVVTAETQSRLYGGDLDGEGGHFHEIVTLTPGWTTVTLPFADLDRPTWAPPRA